MTDPSRRHQARSWFRLSPVGIGLLLLMMWVLYVVSPLLTAVTAAAAMFVVIRQGMRWRKIALLSLLTPVVLVPAGVVANASVGYAAGSAKHFYYGRPGLDSGSIDRRTRLGRSGGGCVASPAGVFTADLHNKTLRLLTAGLGPMRSSYTGPYPTTRQVFDRLEQQSEPREASEVLATDRLAIEGREITLQNDRFHRWLEFFVTQGNREAGVPAPPIRVAVFEWPCVVVELPEIDSRQLRKGWLWWIDGETGRSFASQQYEWWEELGIVFPFDPERGEEPGKTQSDGVP